MHRIWATMVRVVVSFAKNQWYEIKKTSWTDRNWVLGQKLRWEVKNHDHSTIPSDLHC